MNENSNKTVLVTGATDGIGFELAKLFGEKGYNLILVARNNQKLEEISGNFSRDLGIEVSCITRDLSTNQAAKEVYDEVQKLGKQVDILVNNVGASTYGEFVNTDLEEELGTIRLNVDTTVILTKLFLKDMVARNEGKILNLASMVSKIPLPLQAVYAGTKAFVYNFSQSIANELKDKNITVTALRPGATDTDFFREMGAEDVRIHQPDQLSDPAQVAKDGYEALMRGDATVVSGLKNKIQAHMGDIMPDSAMAERMHKMNLPVDKEQ